jgi:hypothetical protein
MSVDCYRSETTQHLSLEGTALEVYRQAILVPKRLVFISSERITPMSKTSPDTVGILHCKPDQSPKPLRIGVKERSCTTATPETSTLSGS